MKRPVLALLAAAPLALTSCPAPATGSGGENPRVFNLGTFHSAVPHAPQLTAYRQLPSRGVAFRDYEIEHPTGKWTVSFDEKEPLPPILVTTASGKMTRLAGEWYPEEGGADSAGTYAFIKGDETIVIFQGTSALTYEEPRLTYKGEDFVSARRYAVKGNGMGEGAPGIEPKYKVYPPN